MTVRADKKSCILCKYSNQKVSTVVEKYIITGKNTYKLKGGDAVLIG